MKETLVVGSASVNFVIGVRQTPELGETILCRSLRKTCGGKGASQAYICKRLGGDTALLNVMGDDPLGGELVRNLQQANVDTHVIRAVDGVSAGIAVVCADEKGNNSIIVIPGANNLRNMDYLRRGRARFKENDVVLLQVEIPLKDVCYAVEPTSGLHKTVILNPAPAPDSLPDEICTGLDCLTPNKSESKHLASYPADEVKGLTVHCELLSKRRARSIIAMLGNRDALHVNREGHTFYRPPEVRAVDTTMTRSTFSAVLARKLADGRSTEEAIISANMAFALTVSRVETQDSIPSYEEVLGFKKRME